MSIETEDTMRSQPTMRIPLTQGKFAIIDTDDWHLVSGHLWSAHAEGRSKNFYAVAGKPQVRMHNVITGLLRADHHNGDGLDNRRSNLRPATSQQNAQNRATPRGRKYKGVYSSNSRYYALIWVDRKHVNLGIFDDQISAAKAYDAAALKYYGEFARLNFSKGDA